MLDRQNTSTWKVLVVEDDSDNRDVISEVLRFFRITFKTAEDGVDGLQVMEDFTPNLILLDLSMPRMDGWDLFARLKVDEKLRDIPVVALTAHAMPDDKKRVMDTGFDGYIKKPINVTTLIRDLVNALQQTDAKPRPPEQKPQEVASPSP
jgi:CheY-like chemotaxis protein